MDSPNSEPKYKKIHSIDRNSIIYHGLYDFNSNILRPQILYTFLFNSPCSKRVFKNSSPKILDYLIRNFHIVQSTSECDLSKIHKKEDLNNQNIINQYPRADAESIYIFIDESKKWILDYSVYSSSSSEVEVSIYYDPCLDNDFSEIIRVATPEKINKGNFSVLVKDYDVSFRNYDIEIPKNLDISLNYGCDFVEHHNKIVEKIKDLETKGLFVFHGIPGTGKSTYIKYLSDICNRKFLFVPEFMASHIVTPEFMTLLMNEKGSVLVIEDAEKIVESRDNDTRSMASVILNLSDGVLADILKIPIIITFNTSKDNIDKALFRKGRLKYMHEFNKLSKKDTKTLLNHIGITDEKAGGNDEMTIADIYNFAENNGYEIKQKKGVGF